MFFERVAQLGNLWVQIKIAMATGVDVSGIRCVSFPGDPVTHGMKEYDGQGVFLNWTPVLRKSARFQITRGNKMLRIGIFAPEPGTRDILTIEASFHSPDDPSLWPDDNFQAFRFYSEIHDGKWSRSSIWKYANTRRYMGWQEDIQPTRCTMDPVGWMEEARKCIRPYPEFPDIGFLFLPKIKFNGLC